MTGLFEDHLGLDAVVAYSDGELSMTAYQRAAAHLSSCRCCAAEVDEQLAARQLLRSGGLPTMPGSLFDSLRSIPVALPNPQPLPGLVMNPVSRQVNRVGLATGSDHGRGRRFRLGAGALVAGIAVGAVVAASSGEPVHQKPPSAVQPDSTQVSRSGVMTGPAPIVGLRVSSTRP